jgi:hypothetical protein
MATSKFGFRDSTHGNILLALRKVAIQNGPAGASRPDEALASISFICAVEREDETKKAKVFWTKQARRFGCQRSFASRRTLCSSIARDEQSSWNLLMIGRTSTQSPSLGFRTILPDGVVQRRTPLR